MQRGASSSLAFTLALSFAAWGCGSGIAPKPHTTPASPDSQKTPAAHQPGTTETTGVVTCSAFAAALRTGTYPFRSLMQSSSSTYTGTNGLAVRFLAVQPGTNATEYPTVVFFDGTSQITPDWPVGMLVSATGALCDQGALVFFDYPGVGGTTYPGDLSFTFDKVSETVYGLLSSLTTSGSLQVTRVDPAGWSLGTASALKFATLAGYNAAFKASGMSIGSLFLIATKSGGDLHSSPAAAPSTCSTSSTGEATAPGAARAAAATTYYPAIGNQAMCATTLLGQMLTEADYEAGVELKQEFGKITFPYVYQVPAGGAKSPLGTNVSQLPYGSGDPSNICAMSLGDYGITIKSLCDLKNGWSLTTQCDALPDSVCASTLTLLDKNREEAPYLNDISYKDYYGERQMIFHFDYAVCDSASSTSWTSEQCEFNSNQTGEQLYNSNLVVDGSPCQTSQTVSEDASPQIDGCPGLSGAPNFDRVDFYIWNGEEDLLIRHDYGKVFCDWLSANHFDCTYHTFANAGHAVLFNEASTIYEEMLAALTTGAKGKKR